MFTVIKKSISDSTYRRVLIIRILYSLIGFGVFNFILGLIATAIGNRFDTTFLYTNVLTTENAIEAYITMLSLVFIVTSIVSVLSDKSEMIYWVGVLEYKLVNPRIFNLTNLTAAIAANVILATYYIAAGSTLVFLTLIWIIIILFIITSLMMSGFFFREPTRTRLERQFLVDSIYSSVYSGLENLKKAIEANHSEYIGSRLHSIFSYDEAGHVTKWLDYEVDISEDEKAALINNKALIDLANKLDTFPLFDKETKELLNCPLDGEDISREVSVQHYFNERDIADAISAGKDYESFINDMPSEIKDAYNQWKEAAELNSVKKSYVLSELQDLIEFCRARKEQFLYCKDELVGISLKYASESNINKLIENMQLLKKSRRSANINEIYSSLAETNPETYIHVMEKLNKAQGDSDTIFDPISADTTRALLESCLADNKYPFSVRYCFIDYLKGVTRALQDFETCAYYYLNDLEKRYTLLHDLQKHNEALYEGLVEVNDFLTMVCRSGNYSMFIMCLNALKSRPMYKNNGWSYLLIGRVWFCFCGYSKQAEKHGIAYEGKVKNLSWFLPEYMPTYIRFLNEQVEEKYLSEKEINDILQLFTEDTVDKGSRARVCYEKEAGFTWDESLDYE